MKAVWKQGTPEELTNNGLGRDDREAGGPENRAQNPQYDGSDGVTKRLVSSSCYSVTREADGGGVVVLGKSEVTGNGQESKVQGVFNPMGVAFPIVYRVTLKYERMILLEIEPTIYRNKQRFQVTEI